MNARLKLLTKIFKYHNLSVNFGSMAEVLSNESNVDLRKKLMEYVLSNIELKDKKPSYILNAPFKAIAETKKKSLAAHN